MAFNPNLSDPISRVRQLIGDTQATELIADATISYYLGQDGWTELRAGAQLCRDLAAQFTQMVDATVDHQEIKASQAAANYLKLAAELEKRAEAGTGQYNNSGMVGISVGGIGDCRGPDLYAPNIDGCCY